MSLKCHSKTRSWSFTAPASCVYVRACLSMSIYIYLFISSIYPSILHLSFYLSIYVSKYERSRGCRASSPCRPSPQARSLSGKSQALGDLGGGGVYGVGEREREAVRESEREIRLQHKHPAVLGGVRSRRGEIGWVQCSRGCRASSPCHPSPRARSLETRKPRLGTRHPEAQIRNPRLGTQHETCN